MNYISGYPRSGNHRTASAVYSILTGKPFTGDIRDLVPLGWQFTHNKDVIGGKIIYNVRNPIEVSRSMSVFFKGRFPSIKYAVRSLLHDEKCVGWITGTWSENVKNASKKDVLVIKYDDWDEKTIKKIADYIGVKVDTKKVLEQVELAKTKMGRHISDYASVGDMPRFLLRELKNDLDYWEKRVR